MTEWMKQVCEVVAGLDMERPEVAVAALEQAFPEFEVLRRQLVAATDLTPRAAGENVRFGRVAKPSPATFDLSIDAVEMRGSAAEHTHPRGEVSLCVALDGDPRFMGYPEGWVVVPPGSRHVPTVTGGTMRILYFLPGGAMDWL